MGNDIVDLALAKRESNWKRKGYLNKLFTELEQNYIRTDKNQDIMVWILWSLKESTYKAYQRIQINRGFYPQKIKIKSLEIKDAIAISTLELFGMDFFGKTTITTDWIHSIVTTKFSHLNQITEVTPQCIKKDKNSLPYCALTNQSISISHHGAYQKIIQFKL
ncbi:4'-phosphopantetheinyl transferase family protein [Flavobacterium profundi]|nr:4'-phosphopantetheinyl transferase superfamily protein [Flavobacterium profundi]